MSEHDEHIPEGSDEGGEHQPRGTHGGGAPETDPDGAAANGESEPTDRSLIRRVLRTVAIALASAIGLVLVLLILFVLALQTNWGGTHFADFLVTLGNPFSEAETEYDELRGNFISRLEMRDLRMYRLDTVYVDTTDGLSPSIRYVPKDSVQAPSEYAVFDSFYVDTLQMAVIDTFRMRYNLLGLLRRTVDFREVYFANPVIRARQRADSTWDILEPFGRDTVKVDDEPAFFLNVRELRITDGNLFAMYFPPDADSVLQVENFNVLARDFEVGRTIAGRVDTLFGRYQSPRTPYWTELRAGGAIDDDMLHVSGLHIESPFSFVTASGKLRVPTEEQEEFEDVDFKLRADPLALRDIRLFFPTLNADRTATIDVQVEGSTSAMEIDGSAQLSDGGSLVVTGVISPNGDEPMEYVLQSQVQSFNPAFFTTPPDVEPGTVLTGSIDVDLEGTQAETMVGSVDARLVRSTVAGFELTEAVVSSTLEDGKAIFDLSTNWKGSTITAEGSARPFDEVPSYDLTGRTRNFNIASLAGPDQQSDLDATFSVEGRGFEMETADLRANIDVQRSTVNNYQIDDGRVELTMESGDVDYGFRFLFPDGLLVANGSAELDDPVTYRIDRGRFENVDLAALLGQDGPSSLNGSFRMEGVGTDPQSLAANGVIEMAPSTFGDFRLQTGLFRVDLQNGRLEMVARADMQEAGQFNFAAFTRPFDDTPTFHVTRGEFTNVNVGVLMGDPELESDLNGTATFTARGFDPQTMSLDGTFTLADSRINQQEINSARAEIDLDQGRLAFNSRMDLPEGDAQLVGTALPFRDTPTYNVTDGSFRNINLAAFTGNPEMESSLNGTLTVEGTGFTPETMNVQGRITFAESRINEQVINSATVSGSLSDGTAEIELRLQVPEGETRLTATVQPFLETPTYTIHEGSFAGINVATLTGNPDWQTNLAGTVSLTGRGFDPETISAEGTIRLRQSVVNDATVETGSITGSVTGGRFQFDADLAFAEGSADFTGSGQLFADVPVYELRGSTTNLPLDDIIGNDTLRAQISSRFDVSGRGTDPRTMRLQGLITSDYATYEGAVVDTLYSQFLLEDGVLRVDSLLLRSTAADARGSGVIAAFDTTAASDFDFVADLKDLGPVRELLGAKTFNLAEGRVEGRVYGQGTALQFDVTGRFRNLVYDDYRISAFEGTIAGEFGPDRELTIAELDGTIESISLPQLLIENADVQVRYEGEGVIFEGTVTVDAFRRAEITGRVDLRPERRLVTIEALNMDLAGEHWELLQEATITYGDEYRVSNLLLHSGDQQIAIDGVIDPNGMQNLVMTIEEFEMGAVADLLGYEGLGGTLTGSLLLSGPAAAPDMSGSLNAQLKSTGEDIGDLQLALDYDSLRLDVNAVLTHEDGSTLTAEGYVPLDLRIQRLEEGGLEGGLTDRSVNFAVNADSFSVGWIDPFLDPETISRFEGRLSGDLDVSGTLDQPVLDGQAIFLNGTVGLAEFGVTYSDIRADLLFRQNQVQITGLNLRSGDGTVRGEGSIDLAELTLGEFDIDLRAYEFLAVDSRSYQAVVSGNMHLSGTTRQPLLEGHIDLVEAEFHLNEETTSPELEQVTLTSEDLQTIERRFGMRVTEADTTTFNFYNALAMDLDVTIERNTWIRSRVNPVMDIQFSGRLDLLKQHYQDIQIFGTIDVVEQRSRIVQFGKRFNITSGTLTFNGPSDDPYIDIDAQYQPRTLRGTADNVTITLSIEGRMSQQLDLELGSDPTMDSANIVSYIATGRPAGSALQLEDVGTDLAFGQLTSLIEGVAGSRLGLDLVTIDLSRGTPVVTAGEYVGSRLFVSVSQPIGQTGDDTQRTSPFAESTPIITLEYEIQNWLLLRLLGGSSALRLNLLFEYSY